MALPKQIRIAGHTVKVKRPDNLKAVNSEYGYFDPDAMTIHIDAAITGDHERELLFHEWLEAVNILFELSLPHQTIQTLGVLMKQLDDQT